jgi:hypothetical protein
VVSEELKAIVPSTIHHLSVSKRGPFFMSSREEFLMSPDTLRQLPNFGKVQ